MDIRLLDTGRREQQLHRWHRDRNVPQAPPPGRPGPNGVTASGGRDLGGDDPSVFADLAVLAVIRHVRSSRARRGRGNLPAHHRRAPGSPRRCRLRVRRSVAACQRALQPRALAAAMALTDVAAGDAPVGQGVELFVVLLAVLDAWDLVRRAELAPADADVAVEDECPCAVPARTRSSFCSRCGCAASRWVVSAGWKPMHQQPPKMPPLASTNAV